MEQFKIASSRDLKKLQNRVNELLSAGYQLHGELNVVVSTSSVPWGNGQRSTSSVNYVQALKR